MEHFLPWHCKLCDSFEDTSQSAACPKTVSTIWLLLSWKLPAHMFHQMSYSKQQTMHSHPLLTPLLIYQCGRALHPPSLLMWKLRGICCLPGNGKRLEVHAMTKMNLWYWLVDAADQMQSQSLSLNLLSAAAVDDVGHKTLQVKIQQTYSSALNVTWLTELKLCMETKAPCACAPHSHQIRLQTKYLAFRIDTKILGYDYYHLPQFSLVWWNSRQNAFKLQWSLQIHYHQNTHRRTIELFNRIGI